MSIWILALISFDRHCRVRRWIHEATEGVTMAQSVKLVESEPRREVGSGRSPG